MIKVVEKLKVFWFKLKNHYFGTDGIVIITMINCSQNNDIMLNYNIIKFQWNLHKRIIKQVCENMKPINFPFFSLINFSSSWTVFLYCGVWICNVTQLWIEIHIEDNHHQASDLLHNPLRFFYCFFT